MSAALRANLTQMIMQENESSPGRVTAKAIGSVIGHRGRNPLII